MFLFDSNVKPRVSKLEEIFANFVEEMSEYKEESRKEREAIQQESQKNWERIQQEISEYKEESRKEREAFHKEMCNFKDEMEDFKRQTNKLWSDLAKKMGTIVEDIVVPNIIDICEKDFNLYNFNDFIIRRKRRMPSDLSEQKEFDVIVDFGDILILNETKSTPRMAYVKDFIEFVKSEMIYKYFPEYSEKRVIPIFSSLYIPDNIIKYLTKNKIYAMVMKEDTMRIANIDDLGNTWAVNFEYNY